MQNIVAFLMNNIATSQQQHSDLSLELTRACGEVNFLKSKLEAARHEAIVDSLTGLYNRRGCDIKLQEIDIEQVHSSLAIDIDHFKHVNDQFSVLLKSSNQLFQIRILRCALAVRSLWWLW